MKKYLFYLPLFYVAFSACSSPQQEESKTVIKVEEKEEPELIPEVKLSKLPEEQELSTFKETQFNLTLEHKINNKKNNIYCVTMLYAWDAIRTQINAELTIKKELKDLTLLNNSTSFIDVLKQNEYTLNTEITDFEIYAKAEFSKTLPFRNIFENDFEIIFNKQKIAAFGCYGPGYEFQEQMTILYYENDDHFVVQLNPTDKEHCLILYKTNKTFPSMTAYLGALNDVIELGKQERKIEENKWKYSFDHSDVLKIPKFSFNLSSNYPTLLDNTFTSPQNTIKVLKAWQRTAFHLDEGGAIIESEAEMYLDAAIMVEEENKIIPQKLIFDKPFLILSKRVDAQHPYFCMWVANTELMIKK
jgi:hypothetical protein